MDPDLSLIRALQGGDEAALSELIARHQEALLHFAYRYLENETAARDVVQETFVRVYFKAAAYRPEATVKTWIYAIAVNLCRDQLRRSWRKRLEHSLDSAPPGQPAAEPTDPAAAPDEQALQGDRFKALRAAIDRLPASLRDALVLYALDGRPQKEVGEILGITPKTVELRVRHAKNRLRSILGLEQGGP